MRFDSFGALASLLEKRVGALPAALEEGLLEGAEIVRVEAQARIGSYHEAAAEFAAWPELKEETQADRVRAGFTPNDPLLRTGALREAIEVRIVPEGVRVGVFDPEMTPIAAAHEYGARAGNGAHIPPRSFLGASAFIKTEEIGKSVAAKLVATLEGEP